MAIPAYDFSSAIDTLGAEELARKLHQLDLGEKAISWVKDYLCKRRQRVSVGSSTSSQGTSSTVFPSSPCSGPPSPSSSYLISLCGWGWRRRME